MKDHRPIHANLENDRVSGGLIKFDASHATNLAVISRWVVGGVNLQR